MIGQYAAVLIAIIMALVNTISVAQSQNETNEMDIGENQSINGNISAFGPVRDFGPRVVDDHPTIVLVSTPKAPGGLM
jgi:hypothetical protein